MGIKKLKQKLDAWRFARREQKQVAEPPEIMLGPEGRFYVMRGSPLNPKK